MTKEQLKAEAAKLGLKIKEGFMDDIVENSVILSVGILIGCGIGKWLL